MALWLAALLQADPSIDAMCYVARHAERRDCPCGPASPGYPGRIVVAFLDRGYSHMSRVAIQGSSRARARRAT